MKKEQITRRILHLKIRRIKLKTTLKLIIDKRTKKERNIFILLGEKVFQNQGSLHLISRIENIIIMRRTIIMEITMIKINKMIKINAETKIIIEIIRSMIVITIQIITKITTMSKKLKKVIVTVKMIITRKEEKMKDKSRRPLIITGERK